MNGAFHFRAAEDLLTVADELANKSGDVSQTLAWAQVHATLAVAWARNPDVAADEQVAQ